MSDIQPLTTGSQLVDPREQQAIIASAVDSGIRQYLADTRKRVVPFVDTQFSFKGGLGVKPQSFWIRYAARPGKPCLDATEFCPQRCRKGGW